MKTETEKSISVLNDLIQIARDGQEGYKKASSDSEETELKTVFDLYAAQRGEFVRELQTRVRSLGGDPDKSGTISGALHRGWLEMKSAVTSNDAHAVLAECERGEDAAVKTYREALDEYVDGATRELIRRQYTLVQSTHDRIKLLRDGTYSATRNR